MKLSARNQLPGTVKSVTEGAVILPGEPVATIGSRFNGIPQELPNFGLPNLSIHDFGKLISPAITIALLGAIGVTWNWVLIVAGAVSGPGRETVAEHGQPQVGRGLRHFRKHFLGGNAPVIVFEDAQVDQVLDLSVPVKFANAGQVCVTADRFYVHEKLMKHFVEGFTALGALASVFVALVWFNWVFQMLLYGGAWARLRRDRRYARGVVR